jgi:putative flippase GtrA
MTLQTTRRGSGTSSAGQAAGLSRSPKPPDTRRQIARFLVVGGASVAVDLGFYALLTAVTPLAWGLSKGLSYSAGVVVGFFGNKFWTFESPRRSAAEAAMYLLLYAGTLLLNIVCNQLALSALGPEYKLIAFLFATGVTTIANFVGMKFVAFRQGMQMRNAECGMRSENDSPPLRIPPTRWRGCPALRTELTPDP